MAHSGSESLSTILARRPDKINLQSSGCNFRLLTFNLLAPCYSRLTLEEAGVVDAKPGYETIGSLLGVGHEEPDFVLESQLQDKYEPRNKQIIEKLKESDADVIFLQEFWLANERMKELYREELGDEYEFCDLLRRSSPESIREREDGLACLVRKRNIIIQDQDDILFNDVGDRVAKMLLLAIRSDVPGQPSQQVLLVNTHLTFPHNEYFRRIRKREITKILGIVDEYQKRRFGDARVPVVVAGDMNGPQHGAVHETMINRGYVNAFAEYTGEDRGWKSHISHLREVVAADHVMVLNPSVEEKRISSPVPDWTDLVVQELQDTIEERYSTASTALQEAFKSFSEEGSNVLTYPEFRQLLEDMGFVKIGQAALTPIEITMLLLTFELNSERSIGYEGFLRRFRKAFEEEKEATGLQQEAAAAAAKRQLVARSSFLLPAHKTNMQALDGLQARRDCNELKQWGRDDLIERDNTRPCGDLEITHARIFPQQLEEGEWPKDWHLSDHGMLIVDFVGRPCLPRHQEGRTAGFRKIVEADAQDDTAKDLAVVVERRSSEFDGQSSGAETLSDGEIQEGLEARVSSDPELQASEFASTDASEIKTRNFNQSIADCYAR